MHVRFLEEVLEELLMRLRGLIFLALIEALSVSSARMSLKI